MERLILPIFQKFLKFFGFSLFNFVGRWFNVKVKVFIKVGFDFFTGFLLSLFDPLFITFSFLIKSITFTGNIEHF